MSIESHADFRDLLGKWGMIAERLASDPKLAPALRSVLGWMQDNIREENADPRLGLMPGMAHAANAYENGRQAGLELAFRALTDEDFIGKRREYIQDQIDKEKET